MNLSLVLQKESAIKKMITEAPLLHEVVTGRLHSITSSWQCILCRVQHLKRGMHERKSYTRTHILCIHNRVYVKNVFFYIKYLLVYSLIYIMYTHDNEGK